LTEKTLAIFQYTAEKNIKFDFLLKVDDDTFVRIDRIINLLANIRSKRAYIGKFHTKSPRFVYEGYKNNEIYYPDYVNELLPFAGGSGYALSWDLVNYITKQQDYLTKFFNEDVAVGTWLFPLNLTRYDQPKFYNGWPKCYESAVLIHPTEPAHMFQFYQNTMNQDSCFCTNIQRQLPKN